MHPRDQTAHPRHRCPVRHRAGHRAGHRAAPLLAAAVVLGALLTGAVLAAAGPRPDRSPADRGQVDLVGSRPEPSEDAGATSGSGERSPDAAATIPAGGAVVRAAGVLRAWDRRRAEAWAAGDVAGLRGLYVDRAGVADVRLLRRWVGRGYRVGGLTTQLIAVEVLQHARGRWRLRVTDRVAGGVAVGAGERVPLPRDRADTHLVDLVRGADGVWRVARVRTLRG